MSIITDITYFKEKFKQLNFKTFDDNNKMQEFLNRVFKSEDVLNSLIIERITQVEDKIEWLKTKSYYENKRNYILTFYNSIKDTSVNSLSQLEDLSKKVDQLVNQTEELYNQVLRMVHRHKESSTLLDTINYIQNDKKNILTNEEKINIQLFKKQLETVLNRNNFKPEDVEHIANYLNTISRRIFDQHQTLPKSFINGESFMFTVHNLTSNTNLKANDEFYRKNFISTSLITDKEMGLYGQNKVGFIYTTDNNVIASESKDVYSYNTSDDNSQIFIGKYDKPTIKPPIQIEQECMKKTIKETGEILNYSKNSNVYNEVVLDIRNKKPTGIFCITNGEKGFNPNYIAAEKLSTEFNLPLIDIDMSIYRSKSGLEPITENDKIQLVTNMLYIYYKELGQDIDYASRLTIAQNYYEEISESLIILKKNNQYSVEAMRNVLNNILIDNYDYSSPNNIHTRN